MSGQNRRAGVITPAVRTPGAGSVLLLLHQRPKQSRARGRAERAPRGGLGSPQAARLPGPGAQSSLAFPPPCLCVRLFFSNSATSLLRGGAHRLSRGPPLVPSPSLHLSGFYQLSFGDIYIYNLNLYMYLNSLPVILYQAENLQTSLFAARFPRQWSWHWRSYRM